MGKEYKQLGIEERSIIAEGLEQGSSRRSIARLIDRPHCTILREIKNHQLSWWFDGEPLKAVLKDSATFGMGLWDH